jgi:hypothetical protein
MSSMTRFLTIPRSPAKAAAGSGALILAALVGVLLAAGNAVIRRAAPWHPSSAGRSR